MQVSAAARSSFNSIAVTRSRTTNAWPLRSHLIRPVMMAVLFLVAAILVMANSALAQPSRGRGRAGVPSKNRIERKAAPDRLIVKFKNNARTSSVNTALSRAGARARKRTKFSGASIVDVSEKGKPVDEVIRTLKESGLVEYAEPDFVVRVDSTFPNDPYFRNLWGLHNIGRHTEDADIDAPEAWDFTTGNPEVVVAVIDTGVDYDHSDLSGNMWRNPGEVLNGIDDDQNGYVDDIHGINCITGSGDPFDDHDHGTHVAGTIGAKGNDGIGVVGVNWDTSIMALKFLDADGYGYTSDAIECLEYAIRMKADYGVNLKLTNNSWGGGGFSQALHDAIDASGDAGMLFVAAAGNDFQSDNDCDPHYPSSYDLPNVVAVAATDWNDALADFSNCGPTSVDLAAPGQVILSSIPGDRYTYFSGTSMATPHVSGAAALIWSLHQPSDPVGMKALLCNTVDEFPALQRTTVCGGRLNVRNALQSCETDQAAMRIAPSDGFALPTDQETSIEVSLSRCASAVIGAIVAVSPDNGDDSLVAHDDGVAPDADAGDGIYSASWTSGTAGPVTMVVEAAFDGESLVGSVSGEVIEVRHYVSYDNIFSFRWIDATQGTDTGISGDDVYVEIPIGFDFSFYGRTQDTVRISSNGYLSFGLDGTDYSNDPIPSEPCPNGLIAPHWDDFDPSQGGAVYYLLGGEAPNRVLTIEWLDVPYYGTTDSATFEVTLHESGNEIVFQYLDVESGDSLHAFGQSATIGIENSFGTTGVEYSYNAPVIGNFTTIWIREAAKCDDGHDNDGDGLTDYPHDPQCWSQLDENERTTCGLLGIEILIVVPLARGMRLCRRQPSRNLT